jgi:hypothetical protein
MRQSKGPDMGGLGVDAAPRELDAIAADLAPVLMNVFDALRNEGAAHNALHGRRDPRRCSGRMIRRRQNCFSVLGCLHEPIAPDQVSVGGSIGPEAFDVVKTVVPIVVRGAGLPEHAHGIPSTLLLASAAFAASERLSLVCSPVVASRRPSPG